MQQLCLLVCLQKLKTFKPELRSPLACLSVKYSVTVCDKYWSLQRIQMYWICQLGIKDEYKYYLIFGQIRILILKKIEYSINMTKYLNIWIIEHSNTVWQFFGINSIFVFKYSVSVENIRIYLNIRHTLLCQWYILFLCRVCCFHFLTIIHKRFMYLFISFSNRKLNSHHLTRFLSAAHIWPHR